MDFSVTTSLIVTKSRVGCDERLQRHLQTLLAARWLWNSQVAYLVQILCCKTKWKRFKLLWSLIVHIGCDITTRRSGKMCTSQLVVSWRLLDFAAWNQMQRKCCTWNLMIGVVNNRLPVVFQGLLRIGHGEGHLLLFPHDWWLSDDHGPVSWPGGVVHLNHDCPKLWTSHWKKPSWGFNRKCKNIK